MLTVSVKRSLIKTRFYAGLGPSAAAPDERGDGCMITDINSEDRLVQETFAEHSTH